MGSGEETRGGEAQKGGGGEAQGELAAGTRSLVCLRANRRWVREVSEREGVNGLCDLWVL